MQPAPQGPIRAVSPFLPHHQHPLLRVVIAMVVITAIAALVAYLVTRLTNRHPSLQPVVAPVGPLMPDAALTQLRLRYARGEVSRTDYLQATADLGGATSEPPP